MVDKLSKTVSWALYGLMAVSALLAILFYTDSLGADTLLRWSYILLIATILVAVASPILNYMLNPGSLKVMLISLALVAIMALISYSIAGNTFSALKLEALNITAHTSRMVEMGLIFTYITAAIAIVAIVFSSVFKIFK